MLSPSCLPWSSLRFCDEPTSKVLLDSLLLIVLRNILFNLSCLNSSCRFYPWLRHWTLLNIKHLPNLRNSMSRFMQGRFRIFLSNKMLFFILDKRNNSGIKISLFGRRFICTILQFLNTILSLSHRIKHLLQYFLLLCDLILSVVAFTYKCVVLWLVFEVTVVNLVEYFCIAFLKCVHVLN